MRILINKIKFTCINLSVWHLFSIDDNIRRSDKAKKHNTDMGFFKFRKERSQLDRFALNNNEHSIVRIGYSNGLDCLMKQKIGKIRLRTLFHDNY